MLLASSVSQWLDYMYTHPKQQDRGVYITLLCFDLMDACLFLPFTPKSKESLKMTECRQSDTIGPGRKILDATELMHVKIQFDEK
jgi:hypothetical protein